MTPWTVALPPCYRVHDVLAFHQRDAESVAEQVTPAHIRKGLLLGGHAVVLDVALSQDAAYCQAACDGAPTPAQHAQIAMQAHDAVRSMLGLRIDPQAFRDFCANDALLGALVQRQPGLRIVQSATVFEALTWAVIGQQINLSFAISLRRTLILLAGRQHSSGLWCYPEAADVAALESTALTARKFSRAKAETILRLAQLVVAGDLSLAREVPVDQVVTQLLAVKGIGPWTVNYALLRGYGYADCSLQGDVAVRSALQRLLGEDVKPDIARTEAWLAHYAPYRTMVAAYLWASLADQQA